MYESSNGYSFRDDLFPDSNANALIFLARVWKAYLYLTCSIVPGATVSGSSEKRIDPLFSWMVVHRRGIRLCFVTTYNGKTLNRVHTGLLGIPAMYHSRKHAMMSIYGDS